MIVGDFKISGKVTIERQLIPLKGEDIDWTARHYQIHKSNHQGKSPTHNLEFELCFKSVL